MESLWCSVHSIMSLANSDNFTFYFQFRYFYLLFLLYCCVHSSWFLVSYSCGQKRNFMWLLNKVVKGTILVLFLILEKLVTFCHWVWCYLWVCHIWPLLWWGIIPLYSLCWGFLSYKKCWIFSNCFYIYWSDLTISILCLVNEILIDLPIFCIPWINPTWPWCMILLIYCFIQSSYILWQIFISMFIRNIGL